MTDDADQIDPREAARMRRRDRDGEAEQRAPMRPGMGKVFKQILDAQRRAAAETADEQLEGPTTKPTRRRRGG